MYLPQAIGRLTKWKYSRDAKPGARLMTSPQLPARGGCCHAEFQDGMDSSRASGREVVPSSIAGWNGLLLSLRRRRRRPPLQDGMDSP